MTTPRSDVASAQPEIHLQPIVDASTGAVWAYESLARFPHEPARPVGEAIAAAHQSGRGAELETACVRAALARRVDLPMGVRLAVNVSPDVLATSIYDAVWADDLHGVIVEVTEHRAADGTALDEAFAELRGRGAQIAVDDVGTGYAGLLRLATMRPDIVKLDRSIVHGVRDSEAQTAVLEALVGFAHRLGATVVGEGVERLTDLMALTEFDVDYAQGWAIDRPRATPRPVPHLAVSACQRARARVLQRRVAVSLTSAHAQRMHAVAAALASATGLAGLHAATAEAAAALGVDVISVSVLDADGALREITSTDAIDTRPYRVNDYPATQRVLVDGDAVEAHVDQPDTDRAERALLARSALASLLMVPVAVDGQRIGVLEFLQRTHRRWSGSDITHARGLATHVGNALSRFTN